MRLPEEFDNRMKERLGEEYEAFAKAFSPEKETAKGLRIRILNRPDKDRFLNRIRNLFADDPVPWCRMGYYVKSETFPGKSIEHEAGAFYLQEPSAMLTAELAAVKPGEKVLDLCAAPGGKATALGNALCGEGILVANEIHPSRVRILSENIERMGIPNALVLNETPETIAKQFPEFFDVVVVDAPCSGEGMFRKEAAAVTEWSPENVKNCALRQQEILREAVKCVAPGGRLIYSTCTFAVEEDEETIANLLLWYPEFTMVEVPEETRDAVSKGRPEWVPEELRTQSIEVSDGGSGKQGGPWKDKNGESENGESESGESENGESENGESKAGKSETGESENGESEVRKNEIRKELEKCLRIWPHKQRGEGHFAAVLIKKTNEPVIEGTENGYPVEVSGLELGGANPEAVPGKLQKGAEESASGRLKKGKKSGKDSNKRGKNIALSREQREAFEVFMEETLTGTGAAKFREVCTYSPSDERIAVLFGENLYLSPMYFPGKGIKIERPGLHIGTFGRNRFEPSLALARVLTSGDVKYEYAITEEKKEEAKAFLRGEQLNGIPESLKGWTLVTYEGYPLGFGKAVGGALKNHYPKGLRKSVE